MLVESGKMQPYYLTLLPVCLFDAFCPTEDHLWLHRDDDVCLWEVTDVSELPVCSNSRECFFFLFLFI